MKQYYILRKEVAFKKNISTLRKDIFKLYYFNITEMTQIPQSTMSTYESMNNSVAPGLRVAAKIADMYCMTLDQLCSHSVDFDIEESLCYMANFIKKIGYMDTSEHKKHIYSIIDNTKTLTKYDVFKMVKDAYNQIITNLFDRKVYRRINEDEHSYDLPRFTYNYNHLMDITGTTYRKLSDVCSIGMGSLTKLKKGGEPPLSVVIKLSDFFGVSMESLYSDKAIYNEESVCKETLHKMIFSNKDDEIAEAHYDKVDKMKTEPLNAEDAKYLAQSFLNRIETPRGDL